MNDHRANDRRSDDCRFAALREALLHAGVASRTVRRAMLDYLARTMAVTGFAYATLWLAARRLERGRFAPAADAMD